MKDELFIITTRAWGIDKREAFIKLLIKHGIKAIRNPDYGTIEVYDD